MSDILFYAEIQDGYPFKNLMLMIHSTQTVAHLVATREGLQFSYHNNNGSAARNSVINRDKLEKYKYDVNDVDEDGEPIEMVAFAFSTEQMCTNLKSVVKKMPICIYKRKSDLDTRICIKPKVSPWFGDLPEISFVDIITEEYVHLDLHTPLKLLQSKFAVLVKDFVKMCNKTKEGKCSVLRIKCSETMMTFEGVHPNGSNLFIRSVLSKNTVPSQLTADPKTTVLNTSEIETDNDYKIPEEDLIANVSIPMMTVTGLLKWHNVSPATSLLAFYINEGGAVLVENSVGMYGKDIICFPNTDVK